MYVKRSVQNINDEPGIKEVARNTKMLLPESISIKIIIYINIYLEKHQGKFFANTGL